MPERASLSLGEDDFDVSGFTPKKLVKQQEKPEPAQDAVRAVSEGASFRSREPVQVKASPKTDRRYRTGRNKQLNTKVTERTERLLYEIYDAHREREHWTLGQIIGFSLEAFQRELDAKRSKS